jgi:hypothetical protein
MVPGEWWNRLAEGELWRSIEDREHDPVAVKKLADLKI